MIFPLNIWLLCVKVADLNGCVGACRRILTTPMPYTLVLQLRTMLLAFTLLVSTMVINEITPGNYTAGDVIVHMLVIFVVCAALFGIEEIAENLVCKLSCIF